MPIYRKWLDVSTDVTHYYKEVNGRNLHVNVDRLILNINERNYPDKLWTETTETEFMEAYRKVVSEMKAFF